MKSRLKTLLPAALAALVIAGCAIFPPLIGEVNNYDGLELNDPAVESFVPMELLTLEDRAKCYNMYKNGEFPVTTPNSMEVSARAREVLDGITQLFLLDSGINETVYYLGENYYAVLHGENGETMNMIEYYKRWNADWENWIRVVLDADTGDIYWVYASSAYRLDRSNYVPVRDAPVDAAGYLERFCKLTGLELLEPRAAIPNAEYFEVALSDAECNIHYAVKFTYAKAALVDIELTIKP